MIRSAVTSLLAALLLPAAVGCSQSSSPAMPLAPASTAQAGAAGPVVAVAAKVAAKAGGTVAFDPARDPVRDLEAAQAEARRDGKRIILDVGGEWCKWCHILDAFVEGDAQVRAERDAHYVWVKVNYSEENENAAFLSRFPKVPGYPHLFVLGADGTLLHSQFTGELEQGQGYDRGKFLAFLRQWAGTAPR